MAATAWTARAVFAKLIEAIHPAAVWIPAYVCREIAAVIPKDALRFYPLDNRFSPDVRTLRSAERGDLVLGIDYFGWTPSADFLELVAEKPEIVWVEDRAHCLWTEHPPWAPRVLYSPRKLVGVADGGILITRAGQQLSEIPEVRADPRLALPELMRFEDIDETDNAKWHAAFKQREAQFSEEPRPLSRLTAELLRRIPIGPLIEARQRNFAFLAAELRDYRRLPQPASGVAPFGFPIMVPDAEALAAALARERLFCPRHWPPAALAVGAAEYPREHMLARQLLTLPCDHRYEEATLGRLVEAVRRLAPLPSIGD